MIFISMRERTRPADELQSRTRQSARAPMSAVRRISAMMTPVMAVMRPNGLEQTDFLGALHDANCDQV